MAQLRRREFLGQIGIGAIGLAALGTPIFAQGQTRPQMKVNSKVRRPNILYIMSDDHAAAAISAYGSRINKTPHIDRLAQGGLRLDACFCTNAICTPSRAAIMTGQYGQINGVRGWEDFDSRRPVQIQKLLQTSGYSTAMIGKWHLGRGGHSDPQGFDYWEIMPGQGRYNNPLFYSANGEKTYPGYATEVTTDLALNWLKDGRDKDRPFYLCVHHKAPTATGCRAKNTPISSTARKFLNPTHSPIHMPVVLPRKPPKCAWRVI